MDNFITRIEWYLYKALKRRRLRNLSPTIIADNCSAGVILHDMGLKFNTPTINIGMRPEDHLKLLKNLKHYLAIEPVDVSEQVAQANGFLIDRSYPVGQIDDIKVHFVHYKTFEDARTKWCERAKRVDYDNIFVFMSEKYGCTYQQIKEFDELPYPYKKIFTVKPYPEIDSAFYAPEYAHTPLTEFKPGFWRRRYIDDFDYVSFLNQAVKD